METIDIAIPQAETSDKTDRLYKALFEVQGALQPIQVDSYNSHTKSQYASLAAIFKAVMPILQTSQLLLTHQMINNADYTRIGVVQTLMHVASGQFIKDVYWLPVVNNHAQGHASAVTYLKRYLTSSRLGISFEDAANDDDGNTAGRDVGAATLPTSRTQPAAQPAPSADATPATQSAPETPKMANWVHPLTQETFVITALCARQVERAINVELTATDWTKRLDVLDSEAAKRFTGRDLEAMKAAVAFRRDQFKTQVPAATGVPVKFG